MAARSRPAVCRYCGETPHIPADSCLTVGQKVGRIVGLVGVYVLGIAALIGLVVWLTSATEPDDGGGVVCRGPAGSVVCEYR